MNSFTNVKSIIAGLFCFAAFTPNVFAGISTEDAKNCGIQFETCTDSCPAKRCSGNDYQVCKYQFNDCLQQHDVPDLED